MADAQEPQATRWLTPEQQDAWRALVAFVTRLPAALDTQLQRDSGMTHFDYFVLATLSEAPDRRLRLRDLADFSNASLSRLSHVMTKLEKAGWARRESISGGRGSHAVLTDDGYAKVIETAPGHVSTVRSLVFDGLDDDQVSELLALGTVMVTNLDAGIARQTSSD
ncbi:MarR family transcriptional regulator [Rhodococcus sp. Leaf7]|uniref:MarR family winged helix-turn-helix transcriptional regulator n=1 Tax=unclassified Rhodococcus (in: high G+C Gram-positive bacteria) TaxID=192944 RepID=UPI0005AC5936|nr:MULTISPECIES: MarR family transcriptional regulator [unclassified Rhodococcus (in: high G+C Gram-positive bacteria)]KIQ19657.1 MarR family transcriptional regulator [Rhodococcus sp. MEB064]KQU06208.1 MarR family transcriptional regulator [Rhodococcus sp. Leaf7]KQU41724.1 MarR family transcriptional regulator [Rhodococcus sp. Leaf247]